MEDIKIGLEIHVYLNTREKLFCDCQILQENDKPNTFICPRCTGQPGSKPMLVNQEALFKVIKLGLVFNSQITKKTNFQRKQYSWPDMPTGFQRTCSGNVTPNCVGGKFLGIEFEELHLEEDPAAWDPKTGEINYNRAGYPLAEIVTKPQFKSTNQLKDWLKELILVMKYLDIGEKIKSDVNVSIKESNFTRVEIKNVNSYTNIVKAAKVEILRQKELIKNNLEIKQETRRFNEELETTQFMRSKEDAKDYMFIPETDLPNILVDENMILKIKDTIVELPEKKREKYLKFGLKKEDVEVLVSNLYLTQIFEYAIWQNLNPKEVGLFLRREILRILHYNKATFKDLEKKDIKDEIIELIKLLSLEQISYTTAQKIIEKLYDEKFCVKDYVKNNNLILVKDDSLIEDLVEKALKDSPKAVEDFKNGNSKSLNFIVGIVMKKTNGRAKPQIVNQILNQKVKNL